MTDRRLLIPLAALAVAACATGGKLRENTQVVRADIESARKAGAVRCAPKELATAEANLRFAEEEVASGHASRAERHLAIAERRAKDALRLAKTCAPTQVVIGKKPQKIAIEKTDQDGDGVPDLDDACPEQPGTPELKGCPAVKDTDGDGVPDDIDRCPVDPEDADGFHDEDGCPDPDNDGDGIVDRADACPNEAGQLETRGCPVLDTDRDGVADADDRCPQEPGVKENAGCPDADRDGDGTPDRLDKCPDAIGPAPDGCPKKYSLVEVKKEALVIRQQVNFATAKFRVLPTSFKLLNQVVQVLNDFPKMRISIEGHTDNIGGEVANMRLSQRRAEAVRDYLVSKGISPRRLEAVGFGPTKPIASNKTAKGKAKNRRTVFKILSME